MQTAPISHFKVYARSKRRKDLGIDQSSKKTFIFNQEQAKFFIVTVIAKCHRAKQEWNKS